MLKRLGWINAALSYVSLRNRAVGQTKKTARLNPTMNATLSIGTYSRILSCALLVSLLVPHVLNAQVLQGSLVGVVTDSTGAVIPGASVSVVSPETGFTREAKTNGEGIYAFNDLQPGIYTVTISAEGFGQFEQTSTPVSANATARVNASLSTASATQHITVTDAPPVLQTDRADTSYNISQQQLEQLPTTSTTGRNFQSLYRLVPGSSPPAEQNSQASNPQRSQAINVNGGSSNANGTRIDGAVDQYPYLTMNVAYVPSQDAIQTVNIVTSAFDAEQGTAGGAAINVILKSGTNQFHGSIYEYNAISQFNARNFFQTPAVLSRLPKYIFNQYGGSIGGPIIKNKLFFFADWESTHVSSTISGITSVPVAALRTGNFSQAIASGATSPTIIYDPTTGNAAGQGKLPFANSQVPVSSAAATLLANLPLPNYGGVGAQINNYFGAATTTFRRDDVDLKLNYNPSEATTLYGHYSASPSLVTDPQQFGTIPGGGTWDGGQPGQAPGLIQMVGLNATHIFTPHALLDANFGYTRQRLGAQSNDLSLGDYGTQVLKIPGTNNNGQYLYGGIPAMVISSYAGLGNTTASNPFLFRDNQYTGNVNLSYNRGQHGFRFGGEYIHSAINHFQAQYGSPRGTFNFTGGATTQSGQNSNSFNSFADFLLGDANSVSKGVQTTNPIGVRWSSFAFYGQDTWAITQHLTVSYGARYELYTLPVRDHAGVYYYNPAIPSTVTDAVGTHTVGTVLIGGKGGNSNDAGLNNGWGMIIPRIGLNYRIDDKTVVRSGFGITVDPQNFADTRNSYPAELALTQNAANSYTVADNFQTGIPAITVPNINQSQVPLPYNISTFTFPQNIKRGYIESWNLAVQRQLPASIVADVAYVGTNAIRQRADININAAPINGGTAGRALNTMYGANTNIADQTSMQPWRGAKYSGLQAQLSRRSEKGVSTGLVYTYSKTMDFSDNAQNSLVFAYPAYWDKNYALAGFDRTNNFQWWSIAPSPFGKSGHFLHSGFAGVILGGWQLQNVLSWYSGTPFTVTASATSLNAPGNTQVADLVVNKVAIRGAHNFVGSSIDYFDPTDFAQPTGARFGNSGRDSVRGPGTFDLDSGLKRMIQVHDRYGLELQVEAFNVTNTPQFANPNATVGSSALGTITSTAGNNRRVRLSARINF
jgi:hypothetical protein